jgi:hypothetical protein
MVKPFPTSLVNLEVGTFIDSSVFDSYPEYFKKVEEECEHDYGQFYSARCEKCGCMRIKVDKPTKAKSSEEFKSFYKKLYRLGLCVSWNGKER